MTLFSTPNWDSDDDVEGSGAWKTASAKKKEGGLQQLFKRKLSKKFKHSAVDFHQFSSSDNEPQDPNISAYFSSEASKNLTASSKSKKDKKSNKKKEKSNTFIGSVTSYEPPPELKSKKNLLQSLEKKFGKKRKLMGASDLEKGQSADLDRRNKPKKKPKSTIIVSFQEKHQSTDSKQETQESTIPFTEKIMSTECSKSDDHGESTAKFSKSKLKRLRRKLRRNADKDNSKNATSESSIEIKNRSQKEDSLDGISDVSNQSKKKKKKIKIKESKLQEEGGVRNISIHNDVESKSSILDKKSKQKLHKKQKRKLNSNDVQQSKMIQEAQTPESDAKAQKLSNFLKMQVKRQKANNIRSKKDATPNPNLSVSHENSEPDAAMKRREKRKLRRKKASEKKKALLLGNEVPLSEKQKKKMKAIAKKESEEQAKIVQSNDQKTNGKFKLGTTNSSYDTSLTEESLAETKKIKNQLRKEKVAKMLENLNILPAENSNDKNLLSNLKKKREKTREDNVRDPSQKVKLDLRDRMSVQLKSARFRWLNEQLYTSNSWDAVKYFKDDPESYEAYHEGYKKQVEQWPVNPLDIIIQALKSMPNNTKVADFGCGEARLAESLPQLDVQSFDLVASKPNVIACDMAHTPLLMHSIDVAVFCLSLMGTNLNDFLLEANRVLKIGGILKIAEIESRFEDVDNFTSELHKFGFQLKAKDFSNKLFYFMDFKKTRHVNKTGKLPTVTLNPCVYKKR